MGGIGQQMRHSRDAAETAHTSDDYESLARLALDLGGARDVAEVCRLLFRFVQARLPISGMFVSRYDAATELRACVFAISEGEELDAGTFPPMPNTGSPHSRAVATGETIVTQDFQEAMAGKPRVNVGLERDPRLPQSSAVVPMKAQGVVLGAMEVQSVQPHAFTPEHLSSLQMAAHLAALAMANLDAIAREKSLRRDLELRAADLEAKVRERVRELASKNRELEAFSFTVAHDLRAPLRAVLNLSDDLLKRHAEGMNPEARADLDAIHQSSERMAQLVEDLLTFARSTQGSLRRELVDLTALARTALSDLKAQEEARDTDIAVQDNLYAEADPALVRVLLDNLLGNAWKYSARKPVTRIRVGARLQANEIVFFVQDEGIGFDQGQASRLFTAFSRLDVHTEYEGTGIGLATAQRIVQRHGGRIWVEAKEGEGATFFFTLAPPRQAGRKED